MRALQTIWDGGGNVAPQLAIARELIGRGHEVTVLGHRCQAARVEATGAAFRPYRHAPDGDASRPETDLLRDWEAKTPIGAFTRVRDRLVFGPADLFARDVLEALEQSPADVVAWDYLLLGAGIGAERAGVPAAAIVHTVYPLPAEGVPPFGLGLMPARGAPGRIRDALLAPVFSRLFKPGLKAANRARLGLGLAPATSEFDQLLDADRILVLTSAEFDFPSPAALPANVRYTGPAVESTAAGPWESPWPADDPRPLVVASLSTTFMDQQALAGRVVEALGGLPVRGLFTAGPAIDAAALPRFENVEIRDFVPHAAVLPEADLLISHTGMGTVHASLASGVPIVCMPGGRDQDDVTARVVFRGAGVRVAQSAKPEKLRRTISAALADPGLRHAAERLGGAMSGRAGAEVAADELEALAGRPVA